MKLGLFCGVIALLVPANSYAAHIRAAHIRAARSDSGCILFDASYGERLAGSTGDVGLWWASSGWKVAQSRPVPRKAGKCIEVSLAQNETECAQLVVNPAAGLRGLVLEAMPLESESGARLPV